MNSPAQVPPALLQKINEINQAPRHKSGSDFVGAVYDISSPGDSTKVALIIGINYGQTGTSNPSIVFDDIKYAKHAPVIANTVDSYHTVVWNFFPYLTDAEWLEYIGNSADEARLLFEEGYQDPIKACEDAIRLINPDLLVFHGVSSAVPILARAVLCRLGRSAKLTPNLSRAAYALKHIATIEASGAYN